MVFFSIILAMANIRDIVRVRKTGLYFLIYVIFGSAVCAAVGTVSCMVIKPGLGMEPASLGIKEVAGTTGEYSLIETIVNWIPQNPFAAMANGDLIQLIFFALFFGIILCTVRQNSKSGDVLFSVIEGINETITKMVEVILEIAPFGICSLMAVLVGTSGIELMGGIVKYLLSFYAAFFVIVLVFYPLLVKVVAGLSLKRYFTNVLPIIITSVRNCHKIN